MSYPIQPYNSNNGALVDQHLSRPVFNNNNVDGNIMGSLFGIANQLMEEILRNTPDTGGISSFMSASPSNPHVKVFGISSMNVTQLSQGPDGRSHIIQAYDERRVGPDGTWQSKKALCDPDRGIDKRQIGYFSGDRSEIIERQLDPSTTQYRQEIQRHGIAPNEFHSSQQYPMHSAHSMQRPATFPSRQYQYYQQQPQLPPYSQQSQLRPYSHQPQLPRHSQAAQFSYYSPQAQKALPIPPSYRYS